MTTVSVAAGRLDGRQREASIGESLKRLVTIAFLGVLLPVVVAGIGSLPPLQLSVVLIALVALLAACSLSTAIYYQALRPGLFMSSLFFYVWFGLAPLAQLSLDSVPLATPFLGLRPSASYYDERAALLLLWSFVCLLAGLAFGFRSPGGDAMRPLSRQRLELLARLSPPAVVLSTLALGGVALLVSPRSAALDLAGASADSSLATIGVARAVQRGPILVAVVSILLLRWQRHSSAWLWYTRGLLLVLFAVSNPVIFPRFWSGSVAMALFFVGLTRCRQRTRRRALLLIVLAVPIFFPYADTFRRGFDSRPELSPVADTLATSGTFSMYGQAMLGHAYVDIAGHTNGSQALTASLFFVPRSLWEGKSTDTGDLVGSTTGLPSRLNPSAPLPVEFFVDFGWVGTGLGLFALGAWFGKIDRRSIEEAALGEAGRSTLLALIASSYLPYLLRGSLLPSAPLLAVLLAIIYWLSPKRVTAERRSRRP